MTKIKSDVEVQQTALQPDQLFDVLTKILETLKALKANDEAIMTALIEHRHE